MRSIGRAVHPVVPVLYCPVTGEALMLIVLHIDPKDWSRLLGVWRAPAGSDGFPESFYPRPAVGFDTGRHRMEIKGPDLPWSA